MGETDTEFRNEISSVEFWISIVAKTGEQPAAGVFGAVLDVAVRTNNRRGSFAGKELFAMTIQAGSVLGEISDIRKRSVAFAHFLPVLSRKLVTGIAG